MNNIDTSKLRDTYKGQLVLGQAIYPLLDEIDKLRAELKHLNNIRMALEDELDDRDDPDEDDEDEDIFADEDDE